MGLLETLGGVVLDVGVTTALAGRGGVVRGAFAGMAGGSIAEMAANGVSAENALKGGALGLLGGAAGMRGGRALTGTTERLYKTQQRKLEGAASAFRSADDDARTAARNIGPVRAARRNAETRLNANNTPKRQRAFDRADRDYNASRSEFRKKLNERNKAKEDLKKENLPTDRDKLDDAIKDATAKKKRLKEFFDQSDKQRFWHGRGPAVLAGLASTGLVLTDDLFDEFFGDDEGGDGGGKEKKPGTQDTIALDLRWVGAGAAGPKMGREPFVEKPGITNDGDGFLLQPKSIHPTLAEWHGGNTNSVAATVVENDDLYGDPEKMMNDPKTDRTLNLQPVPTLRASDKDLGIGAGEAAGAYDFTVGDINKKTQLLDAAQSNIAMVITETEKITKAGREYMADFITRMNDWVQRAANGSNGEFLVAMMTALDEMTEKIEMDNASSERLAKHLEQQEKQLSDDKKAAQDLANRVGQYGNNQYDPNAWARMNPQSNPATNFPDPSKINGYNTNDLDGTGKSKLQDAVDKIEQASNPGLDPANTPGTNTPGTNTPGTNMPGADMPGTSMPGAAAMSPPMNAGTDMMGPLMGSLMSSMLPTMTRHMDNNDLAARREDLDPSRSERALTPPAPPTTPAPVNTTPWSHQGTPAAQPVAQAAPPASSTGTSAPTGAIPPRNPDYSEGKFFDFPGRPSQWVSLAVYEALTKSFANKKGTDAQEAYADTPAMWTDPKEIGLSVGSLELMTGDVAVWNSEPDSAGDDGTRTAILVVFGPWESGTLEAVVDGELRPFADELSDSAGKLGAFAGFRHPKGIEAPPQKDEQTATGASDQPAVPADAPAMVAPA